MLMMLLLLLVAAVVHKFTMTRHRVQQSYAG
jgi:hypothetical protein